MVRRDSSEMALKRLDYIKDTYTRSQLFWTTTKPHWRYCVSVLRAKVEFVYKQL